MEIGDIISLDGEHWQAESQRDRLFVLRSWDNRTIEVHPRDEKAKLVAHPNRWPFLTAPIRTSEGPMTKITIVRERKVWLLEPLVDWVPSSRLRAGGAFFLNPALKLKRGEILIVHYKSERMSRVTVTPTFGTSAQRRARATVKPVKILSVHDRIANDLFDDL